MAGSATIGALRAVFGADTAAFEKGVTRVQRDIKKTTKSFQRMGKKISGIGRTMSVGITAPLALIGVTSLKAGAQHAEAMAQVEAGLKSMGDASGKSLDGLQKNAEALEGLSNFNADDVLRKVTANMLTFGNISGTEFDRAQQAAVDLSERLDQDLKTSTIAVGKALNDPVLGLTALSRVGIQFTNEQKELVKGMVKAGDVAGAQGVILAELEKQYAGSAKAAQDAVPGSDLQDAYARFSRVVGELALQVLPPLTAALTSVLDKFNNLSPGMRKTIVIAGGVLAAIGPIVSIVGTLVTVLAPLSAAFAVLSGATALGGTAAALVAILGPLGLVAAGLTALYMGYKTLAPAIRDNKKARDELYGVIGDNESLLNREKATTLAGARAQLTEAKAIRENIKARLEQQEAILKKQAKGFVALNSNSIGRGLGQLGLNKKIAENMSKTAMAVKDARKALMANEKASADLQAQYDALSGSAKGLAGSTGEMTAEQRKAILAAQEAAEATAKRSKELMDAHKSLTASTAEEIQNNEKLTEALKVSQREYEITAEKIALVEQGFQGTDAAARDLAISLIDSRASFDEVKSSVDAQAAALEEAKQKAIDYAEEVERAAQRAAEAHNSVVSSYEKELENNQLLIEALRISQREYEITAEKIRLMEQGFTGTDAAARKMAETIVQSRSELGELQKEAAKTDAALKKTGDTGVDAFSRTLNSFQSLIQGIKDGDIGSILGGVADVLGQIFGGGSSGGGSGGGLSGIFSSITSLFGGKSSGGGGGGISSLISSFSPKTSSLSSPKGSSFSTNKARMPQGGSVVKVDISTNKFLDTEIDKRAATVAAPIAEITTVKGVSEYNRTASQSARQSLRRGR